MSAATVMPNTATSYANGGDMSASTRRNAGSASLPVTNNTRRGASRRPPAAPPAPAPRRRGIGMVIPRLGDVADGVDKHQRRWPAISFVVATDPPVLEVPPWKRRQPLRDLGVVVCRFFC